jgi:Na+/H+-dicarboxylate symporter
MCRTSVNVFSDTVGAVVIARTEGETPYENVGNVENVEHRTSNVEH